MSPPRRWLVGRAPHCDLILNHPTVSSYHCSLTETPTGFLLEDLRSASGTYVNGQRIARPVRVGPGDLIRVAGHSFRLTAAMIRGSERRREVTLEARRISVAVAGRVLIEDVSLTVYPGELVGLMGPSGAGKTTLMNSLNGYTAPTRGTVLLNGRSLNGNYARFAPYLGYVPQDDIIHRDLTVGQALYHTACLRLPSRCGHRDIEARVRAVLRQLGLEGTEDVRIGSPERRGISGGQRKRVNLALELLSDPLVLYLDEPTSGLSSEDALTVLRLLRGLADAGKTVLLTIHQPSLEAFRLLDNLAVVSRDGAGPGKLVYYGPAYPDALEFFQPATPASELRPEGVLRSVGQGGTHAWSQCYQASAHCRLFVQERAGRPPAGGNPAGMPPPQRVSFCSQWWTLVRRCLAIKAHDTWNTAILMAQAPVIAALIVLVYGKQMTARAVGTGWFEVAGAVPAAVFLLALAALWFGCSNSVREVVGEWAIYRRERMVRLRLLPYLASKFAVLGLLCLVQCIVLLAVVYWGCGLRGPWGPMFGTLLLTSLVGVALGLTVSAVVRTSEVAIALLPLLLLPMVILGGVLQPIPKMHRGTQTACQAMALRWSFEALLVLESGSRETTPLALAGAATAADEANDMAESHFPRQTHRFGAGRSALALGMMLALLTSVMLLVLRTRDVH